MKIEKITLVSESSEGLKQSIKTFIKNGWTKSSAMFISNLQFCQTMEKETKLNPNGKEDEEIIKKTLTHKNL